MPADDVSRPLSPHLHPLPWPHAAPAAAPKRTTSATAARLKPRAATALPTPKNAGGKGSTFFTGVLVAVALAAGIVVGSLVFKLF